MGVELPLRVVVTILECCVTFSGVKLSIRSFVLLLLWGHSNPNWKRQLSIEMITNMTKRYFICSDIQVPIDRTLPYNFCWDIQTPTAKDSSVSKWFQRWQNLTSFARTFKFKMKKTIQYQNDFKDARTLHLSLGHSNSSWLNLAPFFRTFKFQLKKTVHYRNDFKDDRKLHTLWGHSNFNWKTPQYRNDYKDDRN